MILFVRFSQSRLLDTPDHFDYDSACTMILKLTRTRVIRVGSTDAPGASLADVRSAPGVPEAARNQ